MRQWLSERLQAVLDQILGGLALMFLIGVGTAGGLIAWSILSEAPTPFIIAVAIFALGGTFLILNQGIVLWRKIQERRLPFATAEQLAQPYLQGLSIRIVDLVYQDRIKGRTFENCDIYGPAILAPVGGLGGFQECTFDGPADAVLFEVAQDRLVIGPIGVEECIFRRCRLRRIGVMGTREVVKRWAKEIRSDEPTNDGKP